MRKVFITLLVLAGIIAAAYTPADAAIKRVASRYNMLNIYGGYATPVGEYNSSGLVDFVDIDRRPVDIKGDSLYDASFFLGIDYATLYGRHMLYMVGFRFTEHNVKDWIFAEIGEEYNLRQYDVELNANYLFLDLVESPWSPYVGAGVQAGFTTYSQEGFQNDSQLKFTFSVNFGLDFKLIQAPKNKSFVTLSSMNNYNLLASDDRPKYLNLGFGLKYYFR